MVEAALEAAIEQPAIGQGAIVQPRLLAQILQDVEAEENCLPLLEFALSQLWEKKVDSELTLGDYRQLGGIAGALDAHAEGLYKTLASQKREQWVKPVMLRLVRTGEGTKDTRQRQRKSDLLEMGKDAVEREAIESVIQSLVDGRLLVSDRIENQDVIDLSHEALMRSWKRLVTWRESDRDARRLEQRFQDATNHWKTKGGTPDTWISSGLWTELIELKSQRYKLFWTTDMQEAYDFMCQLDQDVTEAMEKAERAIEKADKESERSAKIIEAMDKYLQNRK